MVVHSPSVSLPILKIKIVWPSTNPAVLNGNSNETLSLNSVPCGVNSTMGVK